MTAAMFPLQTKFYPGISCLIFRISLKARLYASVKGMSSVTNGLEYANSKVYINMSSASSFMLPLLVFKLAAALFGSLHCTEGLTT